MYAKKGIVASHARLRRLRPDFTPGRSASGTASTAMDYPTFPGQSAAIFAFAAVCCGMLANFACA